MSLLDFIKNRQSPEQSSTQQSQQQKPETYKQQMTREVAEEKSTAKPISQISPDQQARVDAIKSDLQKATQSQGQTVEAPVAAPQDGATNPQPMAQKMVNQDKATAELSPTSMQAGTRAAEQDAPSAGNQEKSQGRPQTISRPSPSWER